ncbi:hypothetical protein [Alcanivorax sp.]|uniref:hypothetical protein n=1 Tax=Alcanivorax sp. TaxID=1872427 RepID=UPI002B2723F1|nr:hypothetical protein [Alcanivorax sp.]
MSWLFVSVVYVITFNFDGLSLLASDFNQIGVLWLLVALVTAVYFGVMGIPILYFLSKREKISRFGVIVTGVVASIPMLVFCIAAGEIEWIVATSIAGAGAGWVFTLVVPSQPIT